MHIFIFLFFMYILFYLLYSVLSFSFFFLHLTVIGVFCVDVVNWIRKNVILTVKNIWNSKKIFFLLGSLLAARWFAYCWWVSKHLQKERIIEYKVTAANRWLKRDKPERYGLEKESNSNNIHSLYSLKTNGGEKKKKWLLLTSFRATMWPAYWEYDPNLQKIFCKTLPSIFFICEWKLITFSRKFVLLSRLFLFLFISVLNFL